MQIGLPSGRKFILSPLLVLFHQQHMRQQHNKYEVHHKQEVQIGLPSSRRLSVVFLRPLLVQVLSEASLVPTNGFDF